MDVVVTLAGPDDDAGIRGLVRREALPGRVRLALPREPNFSLGCAVTGDDYRIVVARTFDDDAIVGVACRSVRNVFLNGRPQRIVYLGQLRIDERFRGRWLVSRGFSLLAGIDREQPAPLYLASIVDGNTAAIGVLVTRRRRGFPAFREVARYHTLALPTRRSKPLLPGREDIEAGTVDQLGEISELLRLEGARRQFSSVWTEDALRELDSFGLRVGDIRVARLNGQVVGVIALWDQTAYKQAIVRGYSGWLRAVAPLMRLPRIGQEIRSAYASLLCVRDDNAVLFERLLREVYGLAHSRGFDYVLVGLDARDPLLRTARAYPHFSYRSRFYLGPRPAGSSGDRLYEQLDDRPAYIDIATL
jgi:hypothetical protein